MKKRNFARGRNLYQRFALETLEPRQLMTAAVHDLYFIGGDTYYQDVIGGVTSEAFLDRNNWEDLTSGQSHTADTQYGDPSHGSLSSYHAFVGLQDTDTDVYRLHVTNNAAL